MCKRYTSKIDFSNVIYVAIISKYWMIKGTLYNISRIILRFSRILVIWWFWVYPGRKTILGSGSEILDVLGSSSEHMKNIASPSEIWLGNIASPRARRYFSYSPRRNPRNPVFLRLDPKNLYFSGSNIEYPVGSTCGQQQLPKVTKSGGPG